MAITYHGFVSNPLDGVSQSSPVLSLTPPASMLAGDLVIWVNFTAISGIAVTATMTDAGGQTWTQLLTDNHAPSSIVMSKTIFWCRFNGTWASNPQTNSGNAGAQSNSVIMFVFRPSDANKLWDLDAGSYFITITGGGAVPFTMNIPGRTTSHPSSVSIAAWFIDNNVAFTAPTNSWTTLGGSQIQNPSTNDDTMTFAYKILTTAGATSDVSKDQSTDNRGSRSVLFTFYEYSRERFSVTIL